MRIANDIENSIRRIRKELYGHPEPALEERWTTDFILAECRRIGLEILPLKSKTGVLARLRSGGNRAVMLRADIDAVALEHPLRQPFGKAAHRCGHDMHTAALLGAAETLAACRLKYDVYFLFQPAEEGLKGASHLLCRGLRTAADKPLVAVFGIHNRPDIASGDIVAQIGPRMAGKTCFRMTVQGRTGHGGEPHKCRDPIVCAAQIVTAAQTIVSRGIAPLDACVFSFCSINGGSETNLAPESVNMTGSIRAFDDGLRGFALRRLTELSEGIAAAMGCTVRVQRTLDNPSVLNPDCLQGCAHAAALAAAEAYGRRVLDGVAPALGSEDFSLYGELAPVYYYWVGSGRPDGAPNPPWHDPKFCADEGFMSVAAALYAEAALAAMKLL